MSAIRTPYGFKNEFFEVFLISSTDKFQWLGVKTKNNAIDIRVSKAGRIKVGNNTKIIAKSNNIKGNNNA
jgi:hypothetical protein